MTRKDRVAAFCDWLETIPPDPPFFRHEDFHQFSDLTDGEIMSAEIEMRRRGDAAAGEAAELRQVRRARRVSVIVANDETDE